MTKSTKIIVVMKSISPRICEKVANGDCTILVSKTTPKCEVPFKCYIYMTATKERFYLWEYATAYENSKGEILDGCQKVIGEFVCDKIIEWQYDRGHQYYVEYPDDCTSYFPYLKCHSEATGLKCSEIEKLGKGKPLYGLHISDLKIYGKPKELSEFFKPCPTKEKGDCLDCDCLADNDYGGICTNNLTRPPSNWCYVEEL